MRKHFLKSILLGFLGLISGCSLETKLESLSLDPGGSGGADPGIYQVSGPSKKEGGAKDSFQWEVVYPVGSVISLDSSHVLITGNKAGCSASISGTGLKRIITVQGCDVASGSIGVQIREGAALLPGAESAPSSDVFALSIANSIPSGTCSVTSPNGGTKDTLLKAEYTLTNFDSGNIDFLFKNASSGCEVTEVVESAPNKRILSFSGCTGDGTVRAYIPVQGFSSNTGAMNKTEIGCNFTIKNTAPYVTFKDPVYTSWPAGSELSPYGYEWSYTKVGGATLKADDIIVVGATGCQPQVYTNTVRLSSCIRAEGDIALRVPAGNWSDSYGNTSKEILSPPIQARGVLSVNFSEFSKLESLQIGSYYLSGTLSEPISKEAIIRVEVLGSSSMERNQFVVPSTVVVPPQQTSFQVPVQVTSIAQNKSADIKIGITRVDVEGVKTLSIENAAQLAFEKPMSNDGYQDISLSNYYGCGLRDGKIYCWGYIEGANLRGSYINNGSEVPVSFEGKTFSKIYLPNSGYSNTGSSFYACAEEATDGLLYCWGTGYWTNNSSTSQSDLALAHSKKFIDISLSSKMGCGIDVDHELYCWGSLSNLGISSGSGVLGNMARISPSRTYKSLSVNEENLCGVTQAGQIDCFGRRNSDIGMSMDGQSSSPQTLSSETSWSLVSLAGRNICAVKNDGSAYCRGVGTDGKLGNGTTADSKNSFVKVTSEGLSFSSIYTMNENTCAVSGSDMYCWGSNRLGLLGNMVLKSSSTPILAQKSGSKWAFGGIGGCSLNSSSLRNCWGYDGGQLGILSQQNYAWAQMDIRYKVVTASRYRTCAIANSSDLYCWGINSYDGDIGDGGTGRFRPNPTMIGEGQKYSKVSLSQEGYSYSICALRTDGLIECLTDSSSFNKNMFRLSLMPSPQGAKFKDVETTRNGVCALTDDIPTRIYCWGESDLGFASIEYQRGYMPEVVGVNLTKIFGGESSFCAISTDKKIYCWGTNARYLLGIGESSTSVKKQTPTLLDNGETYSDLSMTTASAAGYACGITTAGAVKCWGSSRTNAVFPEYFSPTQINIFNGEDPQSIAVREEFYGVQVCILTGAASSEPNKVKCAGTNAQHQLIPTMNDLFSVTSPTLLIGQEGLQFKKILNSQLAVCAVDINDRIYCNHHPYMGKNSGEGYIFGGAYIMNK